MQAHKSILNHFLVEIFNEILKTEELYIAQTGFPNLSLRELHVIEAVCHAEDHSEDNRSASIAKQLRITAGTLTTSVNILEKKGFLYRQRDDRDKRVVRIFATELGRIANQVHEAFHREMVDDILQTLTEEEATVFVRALSSVSAFFRAKYEQK